jgi:hypothetical protein
LTIVSNLLDACAFMHYEGTGPFMGTIDTNNKIRFLGLLQPDGSLSGSYCSVQLQSTQQCDQTMGRGSWQVTKQ